MKHIPDSAVPKTIRKWIDAHPGVIADVDRDSGFTTKSGKAWDILLSPGWSAEDCAHIIIEETVRDVMDKLATVDRCGCEECKPKVEWTWGGRQRNV